MTELKFFNPSKLEEQLLKKPLTITKEAYEQYGNDIRFNEFTSMDQAARKLTRNVLLSANHVEVTPKGYYRFRYGTMYITVNLDKMQVTSIKARQKKARGWKKDMEKYEEYNRILNIQPDMVLV